MTLGSVILQQYLSDLTAEGVSWVLFLFCPQIHTQAKSISSGKVHGRIDQLLKGKSGHSL